MRRMAALVLALVLVSIGCGSDKKDREFIGPNDDAEGTTATKDGKPVASGAIAGPGGGSSGTVSAGRGGVGGTGSGGIGSAEASGTTLPPGSGPIKIGFHYSQNLDTAYKALGASGSFVNMVAAIESMVKYVNANGGLGGKKVVPVYHGTDPLNGTFPAQAEAACAHFAQDEKVFATVQGAVLPDINSAACHAKHRSPLVWSYQYLLDRRSLLAYEDYLYQPHGIGVDRYRFYIDALWQAGFLTKASKVGLLRYDDPIHKLFLDTVVKPGLAKYGLTVLDKAVRRPQAASEAGEAGAQVASAGFDFKSKDIDRVLFVPSGGAIPFITGPTAQNQDYYPRYAFTSFDIPNFITDNLSDRQLKDAVTLGWMPTNDTYLREVPKDPDLDRCLKAAGVQSTTVVRFCDGLFFLKEALDKTPKFSPAGLEQAAHALGAGFRTPWSLATKVGPGRHDGATAYRLMRFHASCSCFRYEGTNKPVP